VLKLFFPIVYRVNWLRAKARKKRWEEELELVKSEMSWTVNCFQYHEEVWKKRAEAAKSPGQVAYGWKLKSGWEKWAKLAEIEFKTVKGM
jgi:hypothetical protein